MKSSLLQYYKNKYGSGGKKVPVRSTGMWYQDGDVVVPSDEITTKGPNGEKDFFEVPILAIGLDSGEAKVMEPGNDYSFPNDTAVYETKMQQGGVKNSPPRTLAPIIPQFIPGVSDVSDFTDIMQGAVTGNRNQMNQGIIGLTSSNIAGKGLPMFLDYITEKTLSKDIADANESKREDIVNMSTSDLQKLYKKYGTGGYDKWKKEGFPKLQKGGKFPNLDARLDNVSRQGDFDYSASMDLGPFRGQFRSSTNLPQLKQSPLSGNIGLNLDQFNFNYSPEDVSIGYEGDKGFASVERNLRNNQMMFNAGLDLDKLNLNAEAALDNKQFSNVNLRGDYRINPNLSISGSYGYTPSSENPANYQLGFRYNKFFQDGGFSYTPPARTSFLKSNTPVGGYSDNARVANPNNNVSDQTRTRIEAQRAEEARRKREGVISAGTAPSTYQKVKDATSFVERERQSDGSVSPLSYVLDAVNPLNYVYAATDLVTDAGSSISNVAQGNFKEAGSDLFSAGLNLLEFAPIGGRGAARYLDDVVQTSKSAGRFSVPTYRNVYRAEHANFNQLATSNDFTGRWALDNPNDLDFYVKKLKTPTGDSYTLRNFEKGELEPVRIMRDRLPEYKIKQQFAGAMPEEARIMSAGTGNLTAAELDAALGPGASKRFATGNFLDSDYNALSSAPFLYNPEEGILDAVRINQLRAGQNTLLGRGKTSLFPDQLKAMDYIQNQVNSQKMYSPLSTYLPFSLYRNGGMSIPRVNGTIVASPTSLKETYKNKKKKK